MKDALRDDYAKLLEHWNSVFLMTEEEDEQSEDHDGWRQLAPADKLRDALESMKDCKNVLDYGCGSGWGSIMLAGFGCENVTSADPSSNAVKMTEHYAKYYGFSDRVHPVCVDDGWLSMVEENTYDGFFCSNVLDVIPTEIAEEILKNAARIVTDDARVIISLNYYMSPEAAEERGITLQNGNMVFMDGILRLVSLSDEQWIELIGRYFTIERLEHFGWPLEEKETRRLFYLKKK